MAKLSIADQRFLGELIPPTRRSFNLLLGTLEDKIRAAAEAGYDGVNFNQYDIEKYLSQKHNMGDVASLLNKYNLPLTEVGCPVEWHYEGPRREKAVEEIRKAFAYASSSACNLVAVGLPANEGDLNLAIRDFKEICQIAAGYGVNVTLEFFGFGTKVKDMKTSRIVLEGANTANGGVTLDTHHFYRGGSILEDLAGFPVEKIFSVHLCDFPRTWTDPGDCWDRPLPGEGIAPVKEIIAIVKDKGYCDFWTLEVLNYELWSKDPDEVARIGKKVMDDLLGD